VSHFDVVVVGSGFGGSVAALRLAEKGYRVLVVEAGRDYADDELPETSWRLHRYLWAPALGLRGIQRIHALDDLLVLAGAGVGGGSLVYANTLYEPGPHYFEDLAWSGITDWRAELASYYDQARRMLGSVDNPSTTPADELMAQAAADLGVSHTFKLTPVGVFFGAGPGVPAPDPYFGGAGPSRRGCTECGECMTGCRHNAKNTLSKNYLALARRAGARIVPDTTVVAIRARDGGGFAVDCAPSGWSTRRVRGTVTADEVVLAAGTYGTQLLLHRMKSAGHLPGVSDAVGRLTRSNSESLGGAFGRGADADRDFSQGVAITSSFYPDEHTHVEPVRFGKGSNLMYLLGTRLVEPVAGEPRWRTWLRDTRRDPAGTLSFLNVRRASQRSVIALVMQSLDNSISVSLRRGRFGARLTSVQGHGAPNPTWIPGGAAAVRAMAARLGGRPAGNLGDLVGRPFTAHFLGGCVIGTDPAASVVDPYNRVHGQPGLSVVDGSTITGNLGVNPSLTITAQAERAFAMWPNKNESDPRPQPGDGYRRIEPVAPKAPVVPADAPAALRY
jgi:cholesterol oxidase